MSVNRGTTIVALGFAFLLFGCKQGPKNKYVPITEEKTELDKNRAVAHPGQRLMETQCYLCHSPSAPENEGRIGPPMVAIKAHYIADGTTKEEFTSALWKFLEKPSEDKAKLRGAVRRFGLMPYQPFKKEEIELIAEYIFDYQIDEPSWFKNHWENGHKKKRKPYINEGKKSAINHNGKVEDIGLKYALETKKLLGKNLMGALQEKGTLHALSFCNEKAYPLTDSMATRFKATIKRVSDKPRNPNNMANAVELDKIEYFKGVLAKDGSITPVVEKENGTNHFYYPIITNSMCIQCHGVPNKTLESNTLVSIRQLYPNDRATGYNVNQVRGIWSITFNEPVE